MKKMIKTLIFMGAISIGHVANAQQSIVEFNKLPQSSQEFIAKLVRVEDISYIKMEKENFLSSKEYEVKMKDGSEFEFNQNGLWKEIKDKVHGVPVAIIPQRITAYVNKSFPMNKITKITRTNRKYEIELTNGLDLTFNSKGEFMRVDD